MGEQTFKIKIQGDADLKAFAETVAQLQQVEKVTAEAGDKMVAFSKLEPFKPIPKTHTAELKEFVSAQDQAARAVKATADADAAAAQAIVSAEQRKIEAMWSAAKMSQTSQQVITAAANEAARALQQPAAAAARVAPVMHESAQASQGFFETLKMGVGIDIGGRIVASVARIPELFREAISEGIKYNAFLETSAISLAASMRSADPSHALNFEDARKKGSEALDTIREKANAMGLDFHSLAETVSINIPMLAHAGIKSVEDQVKAVTLLMSFMQSKGIQGFQAQRDIIDVLNGMGERTIAGKELKSIGVSNESIAAASASGELLAHLTERLGAFQDSATAAADSYSGRMNVVRNELGKLAGDMAKPIFDVISASLGDFTKALGNKDLKTDITELTKDLAALTQTSIQVGAWLGKNTVAFVQMMRAANDARKDIAQHVANDFGPTTFDFTASPANKLAGRVFAGKPEEKEQLRRELEEMIREIDVTWQDMIKAHAPVGQLDAMQGESELAKATLLNFDNNFGKKDQNDAARASRMSGKLEQDALGREEAAIKKTATAKEDLAQITGQLGLLNENETGKLNMLTAAYEKQRDAIAKVFGAAGLQGADPAEFRRIMAETIAGMDPTSDLGQKVLNSEGPHGLTTMIANANKMGEAVMAQQKKIAEGKEADEKRSRAHETEILELQSRAAFANGKDAQGRNFADLAKARKDAEKLLTDGVAGDFPEALSMAKQLSASEQALKNKKEETKEAEKAAKEAEKAEKAAERAAGHHRRSNLDAAFDAAAAPKVPHSGLAEFDYLQSRSTRSTFQFSALDAFQAFQDDSSRRRPVSSFPLAPSLSAAGGGAAASAASGGGVTAMLGMIPGAITQLQTQLAQTNPAKAAADVTTAMQSLGTMLITDRRAAEARLMETKKAIDKTNADVRALQQQIAHNRG